MKNAKYDIGYKRRYAIYGHYRDTKKSYSEYVYDFCKIFAREQFKTKHPNIVIDTIRREPY